MSMSIDQTLYIGRAIGSSLKLWSLANPSSQLVRILRGLPKLIWAGPFLRWWVISTGQTIMTLVPDVGSWQPGGYWAPLLPHQRNVVELCGILLEKTLPANIVGLHYRSVVSSYLSALTLSLIKSWCKYFLKIVVPRDILVKGLVNSIPYIYLYIIEQRVMLKREGESPGEIWIWPALGKPRGEWWGVEEATYSAAV